jgi:hypothetical protein
VTQRPRLIADDAVNLVQQQNAVDAVREQQSWWSWAWQAVTAERSHFKFDIHPRNSCDNRPLSCIQRKGKPKRKRLPARSPRTRTQAARTQRQHLAQRVTLSLRLLCLFVACALLLADSRNTREHCSEHSMSAVHL